MVLLRLTFKITCRHPQRHNVIAGIFLLVREREKSEGKLSLWIICKEQAIDFACITQRLNTEGKEKKKKDLVLLRDNQSEGPIKGQTHGIIRNVRGKNSRCWHLRNLRGWWNFKKSIVGYVKDMTGLREQCTEYKIWLRKGHLRLTGMITAEQQGQKQNWRCLCCVWGIKIQWQGTGHTRAI